MKKTRRGNRIDCAYQHCIFVELQNVVDWQTDRRAGNSCRKVKMVMTLERFEHVPEEGQTELSQD